METQQKRLNIPWLPILLVLWNTLDIVVHIAVNMVEPLRIAGNIVGLVAAMIVMLGLVKPYQPVLLGMATATIIILNAVESALYGYVAPMLVFVGFSVLLLLLMTQNAVAQASATTTAKDAKRPIYLRWWVAIPATLAGLVPIALVG